MPENLLPEEETNAQEEGARAQEPPGKEGETVPEMVQQEEVPAVNKPTFGSMRPSTHLITFVLIGVNVLIFILMAVMGVDVFKPTTASILDWGANFQTADARRGLVAAADQFLYSYRAVPSAVQYVCAAVCRVVPGTIFRQGQGI